MRLIRKKVTIWRLARLTCSRDVRFYIPTKNCDPSPSRGLLYNILTSIALLVSFGVSVVGASPYPKLRQRFDAKLQRNLERSLVQLGLSRAVRRKQLSVALVDITEPSKPRVAAVKGRD